MWLGSDMRRKHENDARTIDAGNTPNNGKHVRRGTTVTAIPENKGRDPRPWIYLTDSISW